jgi:hypothetical protein
MPHLAVDGNILDHPHAALVPEGLQHGHITEHKTVSKYLEPVNRSTAREGHCKALKMATLL